MSCPICGERCRCAEPRTYASPEITLAEVDAYDPSEEQFASSVAGMITNEEEQGLTSGTLQSARERYERMRTEEVSQEVVPAAVSEAPDEWRKEVLSRVQSYKARRRHKLGDESLSFNFESTAGNHVFLQPERPPEPVAAYNEPEQAPSYYAPHAYATEPVFQESSSEPMDQPTSEMQSGFTEMNNAEASPVPNQETGKVIFFPKPPISTEYRANELAEPVFDTPRILDAPEDVQQMTIPLADITLQPEDPEELWAPNVEADSLPERVAPIAQRVVAELLDTLIILLGTGLFGAIVAHLVPASLTVDKRGLFVIMVAVPGAFWAAFQYLFLVHGEGTPGMQMAQLRLATFDGEIPSITPRRCRALALLVSVFPLGLGLMWSFVDPDRLCWHDRISRTYMTTR